MNKYTQHTPGPWIIDSEGEITDHSGRVIAPLVHGHNVPSLAFPRGSGHYIAEDDGGAANARLIAAAPLLLEALKKCEAALSTLRKNNRWDVHPEDFNDDVDEAVDAQDLATIAIRQAEGGAA